MSYQSALRVLSLTGLLVCFGTGTVSAEDETAKSYDEYSAGYESYSPHPAGYQVDGEPRPNSIRYYGPGRSWYDWESQKLPEQKNWVRGRNTWWFFTGGSERFYRELSVRLGKLDVSVEFFRLLDSRKRHLRFQQVGLINEPNFKLATKPNKYGLWLDEPMDADQAELAKIKDYLEKLEDDPQKKYYLAKLEECYPDLKRKELDGKAHGRYPGDPFYPKYQDESDYGLPTGVVGLRMFKNPKFTPEMDHDWQTDWKKWWDASNHGKDLPDDPKLRNPVADYMANPGKVEPPYLVGITCAFCHVAFDPTNPPDDPVNPRWENLSANIGNQYFREGDLFFGWGRLTGGDANPDQDADLLLDPYRTKGLDRNNILYQYGHLQESGTSETSRFSYDFINNPNTINKLFFVYQRPRFHEKTPQGKTVETLHVLKDGADSVGIPAALARVYINIGGESEYWLSKLWNPIEGTGPHPVSIAELVRDKSVPDWRIQEIEETIPMAGSDWNRIVSRVPDLAVYLTSYNAPFTLEEAIRRAELKAKNDENKNQTELNKLLAELDALRPNPDRVRSGAAVFARYCAKCHSNRQPTYPMQPEDAAMFYQQTVNSSNFRQGNPLTNDRRYPVTLIGTNSQRAFATNAIEGEIWAEFSSQDYKTLPSVGTLRFETPLNLLSPLYGERPIRTTFVAPAGGRGYYRTASLVSLWATAPFLHNNSVGRDPYDKINMIDETLLDPTNPDHKIPTGNKIPKGFDTPFTVTERVELFEDAIEKMLGLKPRLGAASIKLTTKTSSLLAGLDRTKYKIKAEALNELFSSKLEQEFIRQINKKVEDPTLRAILEAGGKEAFAQGREQLPGILKKLAEQKAAIDVDLGIIVNLVKEYFADKAVKYIAQQLQDRLGLQLPNELKQQISTIVKDIVGEFDLAGFLESVGGTENLFLAEVPAGTPLNLLLNQNIRKAPYVIHALNVYKNDPQKLAETLLKLSDCPDIVEDRGHYFPTPEDRKRDGITDADLRDLIEFLKTL